MAIPAVQAQQPDSNPLNFRLLENLPEMISSDNTSGTLYRVAAIVCAVALITIFGVAGAAYLGLLATPPIWVSIAGIVAAMGCLQGLNLWHTGTELFEKRDYNQKMLDSVQAWNDKSEDHIEQHLAEAGLTIAEIDHLRNDVTELEALSPGRPLHALTPLIARHTHECEVAEKMKGIAEENLRLVGYRGVGENQLKLTHKEFEDLDFNHFSYGMSARESLAKHKFDSAVLLQSLARPTRVYSCVESEEGNVNLYSSLISAAEVANHGTLTMKPFQNRLMEYVQVDGLLARKENNFFTPVAGAALTTDDFARLPTSELRTRIFG